jgi:ribonuclease Z
MKLTILGSSSALPTSERNPSAHVLCAHERFFLIDCGEGTQHQLRKNHIRFSKINHIFISHLHGDHVFGLYGLLSTLSLMGRQTPVHLYAPQNFGQMINSHLNDFDIHLNFELDFIPLSGKDPVQILDDKYLTVTSFPLKHRIPTFGFLFRDKTADRNIKKESIEKYKIPVARINSIKKGADLVLNDGTIIKNEELTTSPPEPLSYAYCSDTKYFKKLSSYVKGVSLLYHEATFGRDLSSLAKMSGHSTTVDAAHIAAEAGAGALLIGHFSARYRDTGGLLEETRELFPVTYAAKDGMTLDIGKLKPL